MVVYTIFKILKKDTVEITHMKSFNIKKFYRYTNK